MPDCIPEIRSRKGFWREYLIRFSSITIMSLISVFIDSGYSHAEAGFLQAFLVSFIRTALIWNGSMLIIQFAISRYSIFKETFKIIVFQVVALSVFVLVVEAGEIFVVENYLKSEISRSGKTTLILGSLIITFMISAIYASVAFFVQWKENLLRTQALEKANLGRQDLRPEGHP